MEFGAVLRDWRARRRTSQLDLALRSGVSARHISFLETGRARPSRTMALRLARDLDVPIEARNEWLVAAGFAPLYERRDADEAEMRIAHDAVAWMVDRHDRYPGFALDRHWRIVRANGAATRLLAGFGIGEGDSLLDAFLDHEPLRAAIVNRDEVATHTRSRLIAESRHYGGDPVLDAAIARLTANGTDPRDDGSPHKGRLRSRTLPRERNRALVLLRLLPLPDRAGRRASRDQGRAHVPGG